MKRTAAPISQRIVLNLDVAIVFEALILNRLAQLPNSHREEWLRGLLVQGFKSECGALRVVQRDQQSSSNAPLGKQNAAAHQSISAGSHQTPIPKQITPQAKHAAIKTQHSNDRVSMATLRKVIG